jgi:hypothetical protein
MARLNHSELYNLFSDVRERHIERVSTPMGSEVVFEIDHPNGNHYRVEAKFGGGTFFHKRIDDEWEEIHSA